MRKWPKTQTKTKIPTAIPPLGPSSRIRKRTISTGFMLQLIHSGTSKDEKTRQPSRLFAILKQTAFKPSNFFSLKAFFFLSLKALHCEQSEVNKAPSTGVSGKYNTGSELSVHPLEKQKDGNVMKLRQTDVSHTC